MLKTAGAMFVFHQVITAAQWRGRFVLKTAEAMFVFHQVITVLHNGEEGLC